MKRGGPLKRKTPMKQGGGFKRSAPVAVTRDHRQAPAKPLMLTKRGVMAPVSRDAVAVLKTTRKENARLLRMAKGRDCLLCVPGVCNRDPSTTVACHSNWREYGGKAARRKADDHWTVHGCHACHAWLDQGRARNEEKQSVFLAGHLRQRAVWQYMADDPREHDADREAARWALAQIADEAKPANEPDYREVMQ